MRRIQQISYDSNRILGKGAFGVVFPGTIASTDGQVEISVAVKRVTIENINKREEIALNTLMDHPNVIKLFHTEQNQDFKFFALELCSASMEDVFLADEDPKKYKGPLPSELDALLQLSKGLRYIHENGFIHRDVKPGNVLISCHGNDETDAPAVMKWSDFGLSKPLSSRMTFSVSGMRGTINWIAPEILEIIDSISHGSEISSHGTTESDTWSAGCVFFLYLTKGKHPFGDFNISFNILTSNPINLTVSLPKDHFAANIIREMIVKESNNRMKLDKVIEVLDGVKSNSSQRDEDEDVGQRMLEVGQLYHWHDWNLALNNHQLYVWTDQVAIIGIRLNERDEIWIPCKLMDGKHVYLDTMRGVLKDTTRGTDAEVAMNSEYESQEGLLLNREMLAIAGITSGTPSKYLFGVYASSAHQASRTSLLRDGVREDDNKIGILSEGVEWTICQNTKEELSIKRENWKCPEILLGCRFSSGFHFVSLYGKKQVVMSDAVKLKMENELLDLCSLANPLPNQLGRIETILQTGIDPNCTNTDGQTPLLLCLKHQDEGADLRCLEILLLQGNPSTRKSLTISWKLDFNVKDRWGKGAFDVAFEKLKKGHENLFDVLKILIDGGIYLNWKDNLKRTALHYMCENYNKDNIADCIKLLIDGGIDVNLTDGYGQTALHHLCRRYKNENIVCAIKILIENGVDVNLKDKGGCNALHRLCENYRNENIVDAMKLLIDKGVDVNSKSYKKRTALHLLCEYYKNEKIADAMKLLIDKGVEVKRKDIFGRTALDYLCRDPNMARHKEGFLEKNKPLNACRNM